MNKPKGFKMIDVFLSHNLDTLTAVKRYGQILYLRSESGGVVPGAVGELHAGDDLGNER